jgi:DNA-binding XRE family transcriptional regulator
MARLTKEQWAEARTRWESDKTLSFEALANSIGVSKPAVVQFAKRNGWVRGNVSGNVTRSAGNITDKVTKTSKQKPKTIPVITDAEWEDVDEKAERLHGNSKYHQEFDDWARKFCQLGATDSDLAEFFEVSESTINLWKLKYPSFSESIKTGKMIADAEVVDRLYQKAIGYSHPETHVSCYQGEIILTELTKHYPPDTPAAKYWLNNRRPDRWRNRVEVKEEVTLSQIPWDELREITRQSIEKAVQKHKEVIDGRYERLGIKREYHSD